MSLEPYYVGKKEFSVSNQNKGKLGETAFSNALSDFPILCNITYGKRQKDIDHLVFTGNYVVLNETKNTKENFQMYYSWFLSHVVDRFSDGLPVAQFYGRTLGYPVKSIKFTLTISCLNIEPITQRALKGLNITVIETKKQLLDERDLESWCSPIRKHFLSVINIEEVYNRENQGKSERLSKELFLSFVRRKTIFKKDERIPVFQKAGYVKTGDGKMRWLR